MVSMQTVEQIKTIKKEIKPEQFSEERQQQVLFLLQSIDSKLCSLEFQAWMKL